MNQPTLYPSRVIVSMLVRRGDEYLFIKQHKTGGAYPDSLHIPGGGLEPGESPEQGARREVLEEVGIEVENVSPVDFDWDLLPYKGEETQLIFLRFTGDYASGDPRPMTDAKELVWLTEDEIGAADHNPPSLRLLSKLGLV
jgi:mutator protein MutT